MSTFTNVQKYTKNEHGRIEYFIKVFYNGKEWAIWKRYSDFLKFDEILRRDYGVLTTYKLPSRRWWNRYDPELLNYRMKELQMYLDVLLHSTVSTTNSLVKEFLEVDEHLLHDAKKLTHKELSYTDRAKAIVKQTKLDLLQIPVDLSPSTGCPSPQHGSNMISSTISSSKKKTTPSVSRQSSIGTSFSKMPSLTAWSKRTDSRNELSSASLSMSPAAQPSSRLQSLDFMRTLSLSSSSALAFHTENQAAVADIAKIESFLSHADHVYRTNIDRLQHQTSTMLSKKLPNTVYNDKDAIKLLYHSSSSSSSYGVSPLVDIMNNIIDDEINRIAEISPKIVLALGSQLIHAFRQPPSNFNAMNNRPVLRRSKTITSSSASSSSSDMIPSSATIHEDLQYDDTGVLSPQIKKRMDLRLRKTPSEGGKRNF